MPHKIIYTIGEAMKALSAAADLANVNTVQDAKARLREALDLAGGDNASEAPTYVVRAVLNVYAWIDHARSARA